MSIVRVKKKSNFTVMSNHHLRNRNLSLKAKGLLSLLLSQRDDCKISIEELTATSADGKASVSTALAELVRAGYIVRTQLYGERGTFAGCDYLVTEAPFSDSPFPENRDTEHYNINTNTPYSPPKEGKRVQAKKEPKHAAEWKPERFEQFWAAYPNGKAKQKAISAWDKLRADEETLNAMAAGLQQQLASEMWQRGIGIPYASTWINQRRWEDEEHGVMSQGKRPPDAEEAMAEW